MDPGLPRHARGRLRGGRRVLVGRDRLAAVRATRRGGPVPDAAAAGGSGVRQAAGRRRPGRCPPRPRLDRPPGDRRAGRRPRCHGGLDATTTSRWCAPPAAWPSATRCSTGSRPWSATGSTVLDQVCLDVPAVHWESEVAFWSELTGREPQVGSLPHFVRLVEDGRVRILLQRLDEPDGPVRAHPDLATADREADAARARTPRRGGRVGERVLDRAHRAGRPGLLPDRPRPGHRTPRRRVTEPTAHGGSAVRTVGM